MLVFTRSVDFAKEALGFETYTKGSWPLLHASAKWFRLGELEFELNEDNGEKEVHIHIPSGAKLTKEAIYETIKTENAFMRKYLPEWDSLPHTCESWMMSPVLKELLPAESNILYFQSLFVFKSFNPTLRWVLEFVFKLEEFQHKDIDLQTLREDTSLQKRMKRFILEGGNPGEAKAVLNEKELNLDFSSNNEFEIVDMYNG